MSNRDNCSRDGSVRGPIRVHIEFGDVSFPADCTVEASPSHHLEESIAVRRGEITPRPPNDFLWDYNTESRMYVNDEREMTRTCTEARPNEDGTISISLGGPTDRMKHSVRTSLEFFGMSNLNSSQGEMRRWWESNDGAGSFSKYG